MPGEAVIEHQHFIGSALPFSKKQGSRFQCGTSTPPDLSGFLGFLSDLPELALPLPAETAESDLLYWVRDSSRRCIGFVEGAPLLTKRAEIELREARKRLPANRCVLDRAAHACSATAMR